MKMVKVKASTIGKLRALEVAGASRGEEDGGQNGEGMQGLYALDQTELYVPLPVIDVSHLLPPLSKLSNTIWFPGYHSKK
jgi:hypothetical protein